MSIEKLHDEIQAWLAENRHLTIVDRANKLTDMFLTAENSMELVVFIHKRAALSYLMQDAYESPEQLDNIAKYGAVNYTIGETTAKVIESDKRSKTAHKAAEGLHGQAGGSREKVAKLIEIWKSGKYTNKTKCATAEHEKLLMSYDTARKALRNQ